MPVDLPADTAVVVLVFDAAAAAGKIGRLGDDHFDVVVAIARSVHHLAAGGLLQLEGPGCRHVCPPYPTVDVDMCGDGHQRAALARRPRSCAGLCLDICSTSAAVTPLVRSAARNSPNPTGGSGFSRCPRSDERMQTCGPTVRIASTNRSILAAASAFRTEPPTNSMSAPSVAASFI